MESRVRILFLVIFMLHGSSVIAEEKSATQDDKSLNNIIQQDPLIQPEVKRREVKEAAIDTENFELGAFFGLLSIEDFGTNPVYGIRLDYHVTEDLFIEATIGQSEAGKTSADNFLGGATVLSGDQKEYTYYNLSIGYNVLPGESFIGGEKAFNTALYLIAGAGTTDFAGDDHFTITYGGGFRLIFTDWITMHLDARNHVYSIDVTGENKDVNNLELSFGLNFVF